MVEKREYPVYKRQRFLLEFISKLESGASATDIQKLVFLHCQKTGVDYYGFVPYKYGPYSFQLAEDLDILRRDGFVSFRDPHYYSQMKPTTNDVIVPSKERGNKLIKRVYTQFPYYAINSEIINRLFSKQEAEYFQNEKKKLTKKTEQLFTVGYEGKSLESFINLLIKNDVHLLCDVRKNPLSRKFGFSKSKLQHVLETIGIKYIHIPEVGIDSEKRANLKTQSDYDELFKVYKANIPSISSYIDTIAELLKKDGRVVLMCYEEDPESCHRHLIRDYLVQNYGAQCEDL